jgi:hypothetical protein
LLCVGPHPAPSASAVRLCLRPFGIMFCAFPNLGALIHSTNMRRLTARLLLLFALAGTFVPPALAATAAPPHACCIRKAAHQCHGSGPEADQRTVHSTSCCNQGCGRGVTTSRSAYPESSLAVAVADHVDVRLADLSAQNPSAVLFSSQSTRAPPRVFGFDLMYLLTTPTTDSECVPASRLWCSASRRIPETPCADPEVVANPTLHSGIRYGT